MNKIKKYFGNYEVSYKFVIIFAIIAGLYTAIAGTIPQLRETSFNDIAVYVECWVLFAMFIITNCKSSKEASKKTFLFFLINQPLVFLFEALFRGFDFSVFRYYPHWFYVTILTIPGAIIAYQVKRKDWLSVLVLSIANGYLAYQSVYYLRSVINYFPHHLLSSIFCVLLTIFLTEVVFDERKHKLACFAVIIVVWIVSSLLLGIWKKAEPVTIELEDGNWTYTIDKEGIFDIKMLDNNIYEITKVSDGYASVFFTRDDGYTVEYIIDINGSSIFYSIP